MKNQSFKNFLLPFFTVRIFRTVLSITAFLFTGTIWGQPVITSFSPQTGSIGTSVTLTGSGFSTTLSENVVFVGSAVATVSSVNVSGTEMTITVPGAAVNYGQITVVNTATRRAGSSKKVFSYTFNYGVVPTATMDNQLNVRNTMTGPDLNLEYNDRWSCRTSVAGDFDLDGKIDFAARNSRAASVKSMYVYGNVSTAGALLTSSSLSLSATIGLNNIPIYVCPFPADMNNDGKLDIIIGATTANFQVLLNTSTGPGNFGFTNYSFNTTGGSAETLITGDFNNDGLLDIAAIDAYYSVAASNNLRIFLNTSSGGTFSFNTVPTLIAMPSKMGALFTTDIDNDGDNDILATSRIASSPFVEKLYYIINNSSAGVLSMASPVTLGSVNGNSSYPSGLSAGDLDNDGDEDIVVALKGYAATDSCLWIYRNEGSLGFTKFASSNLVGTAHNNAVNSQLRIVDLNGDGWKDLVWSQTGNGKYYCVLSQHTGGALNSSSFAAHSTYTTNNFGFSMDDFNQDGKVDIIEPTYMSSSLGLISNMNTIYYSKASGDLSLASNWNSNLDGTGSNASSLVDGTKTYVLANRSSYTLTNAVTINNLTLDGTRPLDLGNYDITITNPFKGVSSTAYVKTSGSGGLKMNISSAATSFFPVGNSAYNPVHITNNTGASDLFTVRVRDEVLTEGSTGTSVGKAHVARTWDITKASANAGSGITLKFCWNESELTSPLADPALYAYGSTWEKQNGTSIFGTHCITYEGYAGSISRFAVMDASATLPVSWLSFNAIQGNSTVTLNWKTASEYNTSDFVIQHSTGSNWTNIGNISAAGNSQVILDYSFIHKNPSNGLNMYRLMQRDLNGSTSYSKTVTVKFTDRRLVLSVYPTPVTQRVLNVKLAAPTALRLFSSNGTLVMEQKGVQGLQTMQLSNVIKGMYYLRTNTESIPVLVL